jgi:hypothetical protein
VQTLRRSVATLRRWNHRIHPWQLRLVVDVVAVGVIVALIANLHWLILAVVASGALTAWLIRRAGIAGTIIGVLLLGLTAGGAAVVVTGHAYYWYIAAGPVWAVVERRQEAFRRPAGRAAKTDGAAQGPVQ